MTACLPVAHHDRPVHPDPRRARGHPRARPLRHRPGVRRPRPRVRHRVPAARQGPASKGETLYTLNWLPIGGFVRLEGEEGDAPTTRARSPPSAPDQVVDPGRRRGDELPARVAIFSGIALLGDPSRDRGRRRPGRLAGRRRPGSSPATRSSRSTAQHVRGASIGMLARCDVPPSARRRDGHAQDPVDAMARSSTSRSTLRPASRDRRQHGALGIEHRQSRDVRPTAPATAREAIQSASQRTVDASTLILGGLGDLASIVNHPTDAARPGPGRHRAPVGDSSGSSGRCSCCRRGRPVGQPRGRQHPAVPAARWRPDADDHAQAVLRCPAERPRRASSPTLVGFVFLLAFLSGSPLRHRARARRGILSPR